MCPLIKVVDPTLHRFQLILFFGKCGVQCSEFFLPFLLLVVQNREVLFVCPFLLPLNVIGAVISFLSSICIVSLHSAERRAQQC